jgi:hypothetical protein
MIAENIDSNPSDYNMNIEFDKNEIVIEKIERIRTVPIQISSKVIKAVKASKKSDKKETIHYMFKHESPPIQVLKSQFEKVKESIPETKEEENKLSAKPTVEKPKSSLKPRATSRRTKEDFDSQKHDMSQTFTTALTKNTFYQVFEFVKYMNVF